MLSPSRCGVWSLLHTRHAAQWSTYAKNFPSPTWSLMLDQLNPVEEHKASQSDMVVRKCCCFIPLCYFSPCTLRFRGPSAGRGLLWTWWERFSPFPVSTMTPTQQISRESETLPREYAVANPGVFKALTLCFPGCALHSPFCVLLLPVVLSCFCESVVK